VDELEHLSLVFAGSRRHLMEELTNTPGAPLLGVGQRLNLAPIPMAEMAPFLVDRAAAAGKRMAVGVATEIYERANGVPNHVQQLAFWTFAEAESEIDSPAVVRGLELVLGFSETDFAEAAEKLSPAQRLLRALAHGPLRTLYTKRVVDAIGVANPQWRGTRAAPPGGPGTGGAGSGGLEGRQSLPRRVAARRLTGCGGALRDAKPECKRPFARGHGRRSPNSTRPEPSAGPAA
jgi:hypothetical protein